MNGVMLTGRHISFLTNLPSTVTKNYSDEEIVHALERNYEHPMLTERLVSLKKSKVKLEALAENPWYFEMKSFDISDTDIAIITQFLKYRKEAEKRELREYNRSGRGAGMAVHCYTVIMPYPVKGDYVS